MITRERFFPAMHGNKKNFVSLHKKKAMAVILNIETTGKVCSAALTAEGMILAHREDFEGRNHALLLSDFIKYCLDFARDKELKLEAVAVSLGPGSYTGLRIGLSEAKGLAYALDIPLIGIKTLELMATRVMFSVDGIDPETIFIPMIDARRMEVYTAAYDFGLTPLLEPQAMVLSEDSFADLKASGRPILFFGSGAEKAREIMTADCPQAQFVPDVEPLAVDMIALADRAHLSRNFLDTAYCTPIYLKDFQATKPKHKVL